MFLVYFPAIILNMGDEESWNPPWDCDVDEDEEVDLSSPFRDSAPESFRFAPIKGHPDFRTAKKHLNFDEVEPAIERIHRETNGETSKHTKLQMGEPHKTKKVRYAIIKTREWGFDSHAILCCPIKFLLIKKYRH